MTGYDVYGNVASLQVLADDQAAYHAKFQAIMQAIDSHAATVTGKWDGAGQAEFLQRSEQYNQHYQSVQAAFSQLITATDSAASNYSTLANYLIATFS